MFIDAPCRVFNKNYTPISTSEAPIIEVKLTIELGFLDSGTINNGPKDAQNHWRQVIRVFNKNYAPISTSEAPIIEVKLTI